MVKKKKPERLPPGIPMNKPWPETLYTKTPARKFEKPTISLTKLDNGIRVISQDHIHSPGAAVGMIVAAGSRAETEEFRGYSWLCEKMALRSSVKYPLSTILPMMEYYGANAYSSAQRETITTNCEVLPEYIPSVLDVLYDTTFNPAEVEEELEEQRVNMSQFASQLPLIHTDTYLIDRVHQLAFGEKSDLGRSTHVEEPNIISEFSYSQLKRFKEKHYVPERIVLAGVGMEHEKLVEMVNKTFGQQKPSGKVKVNENASTTSPYYLDTSFSTYRGGALYVEDQRKEAEDAAFLYPPYFKFDASVVVAFEAPGLFSGPDFYSACLLQWLMGSGGSFTSGGPGKGMYSRTYQDVLCYSYVETASTFHWPYSDTGLFGLWLTGRQERVFHLLELSINTLHNMAKIDEDEFIRARNQVKSSLFSNLETRGVILEDLQKQSLLYNLYTESSEHVAMLDQLTVESVQEFAVRMLTRHPPTVLIYSDPKFYNADQVAGTDAHIHQFLRSKFNS